MAVSSIGHQFSWRGTSSGLILPLIENVVYFGKASVYRRNSVSIFKNLIVSIYKQETENVDDKVDDRTQR